MTDLIPRTRRPVPAGRRLGEALRDQPLLGLLPLRLFLGFTFAFAGLQKLADPSFFDPANPQSIQGQLGFVRDASPLRLLLGPVADHAVLFGVLIALTELSVGVATLLGLWQRLAAAVGALVALSFYLTISWQTRPYYYGSDIGFFFAWTPLALLGSPVLSLDAWRRGRRQLPRAAAGEDPAGPADPTDPADPRPEAVDVDRRAVLATGAVGAVVLTAAGLDAGIGRALRGGGGSPAGAGTPSPTGAAPTTAPGAAPTTAPGGPAAAAGGTVIGSVRDLPVGSALRFTDPGSGAVAFAVQPAAGQFRAFSAICSHAGCTVAYARRPQQFRCPCHGGVYDGRTGEVLSGPPPAPLQPIEVTESGGNLVVPDPS